MMRLSAAFAKGHPALVTFVTAGDPHPGATGASPRCARRGRRGRDRTGHAVHRSDGRRPGDPGGEPAQRSPAGTTHRRRAGDRQERSALRHPDVPLVLMGYANTDDPARPRTGLCRSGGREGRRRTA